MNNALILVSLLLQYSDKIAAVGGLLRQAHAENRDVTEEELNNLFLDDDIARADLMAAAAAARK